MSKKVKEKEPYVLMVTGCDESIPFQPPQLISGSLEYLESLIDQDMVSEWHQGIVYALQELLSCPTVLFQERVEALLEETIEEIQEDETETETTEGEEDMSKSHRRIGFIERKQDDISRACNPTGEVATLPPVEDDDISDEELLAEYRKAPNMSHYMDM